MGRWFTSNALPEAGAYVGGQRRYRAIINNDGGAVPIWELAQNNPSNGGEAA